MALTKQQAYEALASKIRSNVGLRTEPFTPLAEAIVEKYRESSQWPYRRFAETYSDLKVRHGGHPDYDDLAEPDRVGETEEGTIATFFLDLRNFTKYCCFLPPIDVYQAKSATIEAAISVCRLYGGHLHEIPGDGVLFFFGGKDQDDTDSATRAVSAACDAMWFLEEEIIPEYNDDEKYPAIYPKMGLDYGDVLWGAYGADGFYEVKATSFHVDIASKMMSQCKAREMAIGDSVKEFLEVDEDYLETGKPYRRRLTVDGEEKEINYKTWLFDWRQYRSDNMPDDEADLSRLTMTGPLPQVKGSRSRLRDAPLA
jgi:adenylate cyclase